VCYPNAAVEVVDVSRTLHPLTVSAEQKDIDGLLSVDSSVVVQAKAGAADGYRLYGGWIG
jgi:hypothetical protein